MLTIKVKYIPRTDKTVPRYKATCDLGTMVAPYDYELDDGAQALRVAKALAKRIGCKLGPGGGEYKGERYWGAVHK